MKTLLKDHQEDLNYIRKFIRSIIQECKIHHIPILQQTIKDIINTDNSGIKDIIEYNITEEELNLIILEEIQLEELEQCN